MSANQLLTKALSTTSEDEAIACLKMARKKGLKIEVASSNNAFSSTVEKEWADLVVKARDQRDQYKRLWADEGYRNKKLQVAIDNAAHLQIVMVVATVIISSLFWFLVLRII
jgi:hypothetical protein